MNNNTEKIKVFIVDDHKLFLNGLKMLLNSMPNTIVIGKANNGKEFLEGLKCIRPDVVLMDIAMPVMDGIEATRIAMETNPDLKIITLSMYDDQEYYTKMLQSGAKGFLLKDSDIHEVRTAIGTVARGGNYFSQQLLRNLILTQKKSEQTETAEELSARELEILIEICQGLSNHEIAEKLFISKRTVEKHRANILQKTACKNTASLVVYAIKSQIVEI